MSVDSPDDVKQKGLELEGAHPEPRVQLFLDEERVVVHEYLHARHQPVFCPARGAFQHQRDGREVNREGGNTQWKETRDAVERPEQGMGQTNTFFVGSEWQPVIREIGLDAEAMFGHAQIRVWRKLADRQNCTLDAVLSDGRKIRLHIKRYGPTARPTTPAEDEAAGQQLLVNHGIPTAPLVAWGVLADGRSFVAFEDLAGFTPADKLVETGTPFALLRQLTADLTARLHHAGLQHRDLYLCHFMVKPMGEQTEVRLIDPARVRRLPGFITRGRWIVKDLSQFWYSTLKLPITDADREMWLMRYCLQRQLPGAALMRDNIERKVRRIARHDKRLNRLQPTRNVSIPW